MSDDRTIDHAPSTWAVRPLKEARREAKVGHLFQTEQERVRLIRMLKLLKYWPPNLPRNEDENDAVGFEYETITFRNQSFIELKIKEDWLTHKQLRVFLWPDEQHRIVWVLHAYWKKQRAIGNEVKVLTARRLRLLKGSLQDNHHELIAASAKEREREL